MARRGNKHLLHELASLPWWVSLVVAGIVFVAVRWLLPVVGSSNRVLRPLGEALHDKAWWFALPFVVVAGIAAFNSYYRRRLLDDQVGLETLRALSWQDFERLVGEAYRRQGYVLEEVGGAAPDGGIDLLLHRRGQKVVVQCKRWKSSQVGVSLIREFYGVIAAEKAGRGIFVTTGTFTPDAVEFASGTARTGRRACTRQAGGRGAAAEAEATGDFDDSGVPEVWGRWCNGSRSEGRTPGRRSGDVDGIRSVRGSEMSRKSGAAERGSQHWLQVAVERHPEVLLRVPRAPLGLAEGDSIKWVSPQADDFREYRDGEALRQAASAS